MEPVDVPQYTPADECWVRGDLVLEANARADARIAELEAQVAERDAANAYASELNDSLIAVNAESVALETERDALRARLAAIDAAPTIADVEQGDGFRYLSWGDLPPIGTELIARPAKEAK